MLNKIIPINNHYCPVDILTRGSMRRGQRTFRSEMYAGRVGCCPWWVTVVYRWDRQTDGRQTVTLRFPLDAASVINGRNEVWWLPSQMFFFCLTFVSLRGLPNMTRVKEVNITSKKQGLSSGSRDTLRLNKNSAAGSVPSPLPAFVSITCQSSGKRRDSLGYFCDPRVVTACENERNNGGLRKTDIRVTHYLTHFSSVFPKQPH